MSKRLTPTWVAEGLGKYAMTDELLALRARVAKLEVALRPFAELAPAFLGVTDGHINVGTRNQLPLQAFADARAALVEESGG